MKKLFTVGFLLLASLSLSFAQYKVSGVIIDADDNQPLVGVAVVIQGTTTGTETDLDGNYSLDVLEGKSVVISYMGYESQTKKVTGSGTINVKMTLNVNELDEVVAIGYGTMKKSDLTGAVSSVKPEQLKKSPASGVDQALQGRVAGVTVNASSGQPGAAAEVRIRGIGTVNDSRPIYVVDGLITTEIGYLSPEDIESTEVLKDASATAIYGSRGANGVVLITTKRGKEGKANISFNAYWGLQNRWNKLDLMGSKEMAETKLRLNPQASQIKYYQDRGFNEWLSAYMMGTEPYFPLIQTAANPDGIDYSVINTDWQDEVFKKNALIHNYHLSIDGGTEKSRYAFSASYFNQDGTIIGSNYERFSLRFNSSNQVRKWLKIGENLSFVNSTGRNAMNNNSSPGASILSAALAMAPWDPAYYPAGSVNNKEKDLSGQISASSNFKKVVNPLSMVKNQHPTNKVQRWVGNIYADIQPIKDIIWHSSIGIDLANNEDKTFKDAYVYSSSDKQDKNFLAIDLKRYQTLTWENTLTYSKQINKHSFSVMAGQTGEEWNYYTTGGAGASILNPVERNWYLKNTTEDQSKANDGVDRTRMFSLLGRAHYAYNNRYMATVTFRADATSKFPLNTWGYFPSVALAWRINEEGFLKDFKKLDNLKLRAGWGQIGNEKVTQDAARLNISQGSNIFTGYPFGVNQDLVHGAAVLSYVNDNCKWETTETWNFGVDFGFWRGLLSGTVEFYNRDTKEMLITVTAPAFVGNRYDPVANVGTVRNQGVEITLEHRNKIGEWNYNVGGNVSFVKNELTALNGGAPVWGDWDHRTICDEGLPLYTILGYEYEGIYRSDAEAAQHLWNGTDVHAGDAKYKDLNGDGKIDDKDKTNLGNPFPWLTYSLNLGVDFKGFDLQVFFQGVYGNKIYNAVRHRTEGSGNDATLSTTMRDVWVDYSDEMKTSMESRGVDWQALINPDGSIPNPLGNPRNNRDVTTSRFVEDGAYLRLKNIQLGYTLPKNISKKAYIERCRFYVSANNLFTITKYTGYDPEVGGNSGIDNGNYPQARTFTFGVNMDF
ncbi:MAG: TonB-dependent receptor [Prevotellaceae bacterium]|jgi:TonB-linked SusC/RagA family outer membrane protein|nr:TonB-dependent receptor [Prevotellaceae bacterium]